MIAEKENNTHTQKERTKEHSPVNVTINHIAK